MRKGSSRGVLRGSRQGSVGRCVGRVDWGGQRSGRQGAHRRGTHRRLQAASGARGPRSRVAAAPRLRTAGALRRDKGAAGVGRALAARPGACRRVDDASLGGVRATRRSSSRKWSAWRCGGSRDYAPPSSTPGRRSRAPTWASCPMLGRGWTGRISCCFPMRRCRWRSRSSCSLLAADACRAQSASCSFPMNPRTRDSTTTPP